MRRPPQLLLAAVTRIVFAVTVVSLLASGIVGGLLRAGVALPVSDAWPGRAVVAHAFLMICAFLGTVIGLERAVASKSRLALLAPIGAALAGAAALAGRMPLASWLGVAAALSFVGVSVLMWVRQPAVHIGVLLLGALAWLVGALLFALGDGSRSAAAVPWWFSFLVLTIAGERLEMTRLMRRRRYAGAALGVVLGALLFGSAAFAVAPVTGARVFGLALCGLAVWLFCFDIARRTLAAAGLSRYMALCLLSGYAWLGIAGVAWIATASGQPMRDLALHALGIGFVFSMVLAHAPVILPALTGIKVAFGAHFYAPLLLLQASLVVRSAGSLDFAWLGAGAIGNALAIAAFLLTMLASALAWRFAPSSRRRAAAARRSPQPADRAMPYSAADRGQRPMR